MWCRVNPENCKSLHRAGRKGGEKGGLGFEKRGAKDQVLKIPRKAGVMDFCNEIFRRTPTMHTWRKGRKCAAVLYKVGFLVGLLGGFFCWGCCVWVCLGVVGVGGVWFFVGGWFCGGKEWG